MAAGLARVCAVLLGSAIGTMACLALCLVGHLGFVVACTYRSFAWALLSRVVFGLGQGSTVVAQGRICATWFVGREIVFAIALTECTHNLSNWIAFVYVVPVSEYMGGYLYALWFGLGFCVLSFLAGLWFFYVNKDAAPSMHQIKHSRVQQEQLDREDVEAPDSPYRRSASELGREQDALIRANSPVSAYSSFAAVDDLGVLAMPPVASVVATGNGGGGGGEDEEEATCPSPLESPASSVLSSISDSDEVSSYDVQPSQRPWNPLAGLSIGFAILCVVHMVYSNCFRLFAYVSAAFIADRYSTSLAHAGWTAGLSNGLAIFMCPLAGIAMDYVGYKMWIQVLAGLVTTIAYLLLLASAASPVPSLVLLAICVSFTPTILKSSVPNLVLPAVYGSVHKEAERKAKQRTYGEACRAVRRAQFDCWTSTHRLLCLLLALCFSSLPFDLSLCTSHLLSPQFGVRHLRDHGECGECSWEHGCGFLP